MKTYTIILLSLFTFNSYAQYKVEIVPNNTSHAKMQLDCKNVQECDESILKWIEKQKVYKGEWNEDAIGSIASKQETDLENNVKTLYFHPIDFSINQVDISSEIVDRETKTKAKKDLKEKLKTKDLTLKEINELLRD